jgi:hypothetical protein
MGIKSMTEIFEILKDAADAADISHALVQQLLLEAYDIGKHKPEQSVALSDEVVCEIALKKEGVDDAIQELLYTPYYDQTDEDKEPWHVDDAGARVTHPEQEPSKQKPLPTYLVDDLAKISISNGMFDYRVFAREIEQAQGIVGEE